MNQSMMSYLCWKHLNVRAFNLLSNADFAEKIIYNFDLVLKTVESSKLQRMRAHQLPWWIMQLAFQRGRFGELPQDGVAESRQMQGQAGFRPC